MRKVRFYCEQIEPLSTLNAVESNHLTRVLRLTEGAPIELFDGCGTLAEGIVETVNRKKTTVRTNRIEQTAPPQTGRIILAVSYAKGQRFDWMVEKCTELGVDHIAAVQFERTVKQGKASGLERLEKIALSAAKQCMRLNLPKLSGPGKLKETVEQLKADYPRAILISGHPNGQPIESINTDGAPSDTIVFIGPEGGFTDVEQQYFNTLNAAAICINPNVLRIETAAIAFCTLLAHKRTT